MPTRVCDLCNKPFTTMPKAASLPARCPNGTLAEVIHLFHKECWERFPTKWAREAHILAVLRREGRVA